MNFIQKLEKIDEFLRNGVEAFSHKFQILTGKNCFFLARMMLVIAICISFVGIYCSYKDETKFVGLVIACTGYGVIILFSSFLIYSFKIKEKIYMELLKRGFRNPEALDRTRIINFLSVLYLSISCPFACYNIPAHPVFLIFMPVAMIFVIISLYFISCTPLPPATSKVKQWINSFKEVVSNVLAPEPTAVPAKAYSRNYWFSRVMQITFENKQKISPR